MAEKKPSVCRAKILCSWKLVLSVDGWEGARGEVCGPACQLQVFQHGPGEYIHMATCSKLHWPNSPTFTRRSSMPSSSLTPTFEVCVGADHGSESPAYVVEYIWTLQINMLIVLVTCALGCTKKKTLFSTQKSTTHNASAWGFSLKVSKRIFDFDNV